MSKDMSVPAHPISKTGFRPIRSDTLPHAKPVKDSARAKEEMKMPAQKDALDLSPTWKSSTMTHAYGKHEARAIGSATRHIAVERISNGSSTGRRRWKKTYLG